MKQLLYIISLMAVGSAATTVTNINEVHTGWHTEGGVSGADFIITKTRSYDHADVVVYLTVSANGDQASQGSNGMGVTSGGDNFQVEAGESFTVSSSYAVNLTSSNATYLSDNIQIDLTGFQYRTSSWGGGVATFDYELADGTTGSGATTDGTWAGRAVVSFADSTSSFTVDNLTADRRALLSAVSFDLTGDLSLDVVPEPSSVGLLALSGVLFLTRRGRR